MKEERQRQEEEEAQKTAEAKCVCKEAEAEKAWRDMEAKKARRDVEAEEAWKAAEVEAEKQWREVEAEETQRRGEAEEIAQKDAEKKKKAEASVTQRKQLELLSQCKVAARIAWEMEAWRALESKAVLSGIAGYGKGKMLEKHVCTNCLRRGVECEWDEGG